MTDSDDAADELLFFDTFSHELDTDINLDLVQFPEPVYITQVRIIPLGARVQADFPGGVRLGATNPSKFDIEFFVNDLGMPGASTFENLGHLEYNQNDCIHLECTADKIPTDGLVLRGWYSTITLAVYGILTNSVSEAIASPPPPTCEPIVAEEMLNTSAGTVLGEELPPLKEEWKEPLAGEVLALHAHKTPVALTAAGAGAPMIGVEYERSEDLDYATMSRGEAAARYQHSAGDDERERRLRKTSHSSERSATTRNRTHSESNERDYLRARNEREKNAAPRDWSRSPPPDYSRHSSRRKRSERSRSDAEEPPHKWPPRTPPACIDSPTRPRSPDTPHDFADPAVIVDDDDYKHNSTKTRAAYLRASPGGASDSPTMQQDDVAADLDDEVRSAGTPAAELFEAILSDDELMGVDDDEDDDSNAAVAAQEFEAELDAAAATAPPAIVAFDARRMPLVQYAPDLALHCAKELAQLQQLFKKFAQLMQCGSLQAFCDDAVTSADERESFVFFSEQLIQQLAYLAHSSLRRREYVLREFFSDVRQLNQAAALLCIALNFEAACLQTQPAFKIRHIKVGARLAELLGSCDTFIAHLLQVQQFDAFAALFALYQQQYMALSIKLMLLKAIYALLDSKTALLHILAGGKLNGYQLILETLQQTKLTRTKYALQAILKKLHLHEALACMREQCTQLFVLAARPDDIAGDGAYQLLEHASSQLLDALSSNALSYQQPRRFLPVSRKFEIVADVAAQRGFANSLQSYFRQHSLAESLLLLFSHAADLPSALLMRSVDLLHAMLQSHMGIDYFVDDCFETSQMLVAVLLGVAEVPLGKVSVREAAQDVKIVKEELKQETSTTNKTSSLDATQILNTAAKPDQAILETKATSSKDTAEPNTPLQHRLQKIGIELAYKIQTRYHLDAIVFTASSPDYDTIKLATHLHALYSQTCNSPGRQHTIEVLGLDNHMKVFMDLIKKEQRLQAQRQLASPGTKYKSPVLSYAVDVVDCCVRYCENLDYLIEHGAVILELAKNHDTFEPSVSAVLQEMFVYLKPLENISIFSYDDITPLVEVITRSLEYIATFPGDLIMGLRILRHLAIGPVCRAFRSADTEEMKHRFVALQFYAADGMQTLTQILEKLCSYFEQPGLHSPALMTLQGIHCCQILLPTLQVLREMLSFAIQCRDVTFKDLTAIDHLMRAYSLLHYFPEASQTAAEVDLAKKEIIKILLAYTQPNEQDEESLHKSLWTQMIREILKNINGPATLIPGLQVLAELLPLPLPIPLPSNNTTAVHQLEVQTKRLITERKLWSAHLHPQSGQIAKLIETITPTSFPLLSDLMARVCLQLADLAPNMTLLISKTLTDLLCAEWSSPSSPPTNGPTANLARLLQFVARLTTYPALKSSALSILSGKLWELFHAILNISKPSAVGFKCQASVHRILESFLDSEISLISPQSPASAELNLASALPPRELIPRIVEAILTNVVNVDVEHEVSALGVRNLVILTEHDITFFHLSFLLKQKPGEFQQWLRKIIEINESGSYNSNVESLILLLRSLTQIADTSDQDTTIPARTLKLTAADLTHVIGLQTTEVSKPHILQRIRSILTQNKEVTNETLLTDINALITLLESRDSPALMETDEEASPTEPTLPQTEGIVTQYVARPIFTVYDEDASFLEDTQLCPNYWLALPRPAEDAVTERIPCDLTELANICLTPETNLTTDCKRVLHLSASPQSNRERTPTAPCFRTRRVEVEPTTGRPEKKIYIGAVRGRGYPRPPPSRGDLFRSRPPNTSRPPSLHVDDFLALETCGAQPTGPTGYNKIPPLMRGSRVGRNRGSRISSAAAYRKTKVLRTSSPSTWNDSGSPHYRTATSEPHFGGDPHYSSSHFSGRPRGRGRGRSSYLR